MQRATMVGKPNQLLRLRHASNSLNRVARPNLSMSQKRHLFIQHRDQQKPLLIRTTGHLEPGDSSLKLPFDQYPEFDRVCKSLASGDSVVIQGPLQSGKTSFLDEVSGRRTTTAFISLGSVGNTAQFWSAMSLGILGEAHPHDILQHRLDILARDTKVCLFIDELHSVCNSNELRNTASSFLHRISSDGNGKRINYLAVGNFMLRELAHPPTSLLDTATIMSMPTFSAVESIKVFQRYTKYMNQQGILPDIQQDIFEKSRGHMASLMSLFKLYHDHTPKSEYEGNELLDVNFTTCIDSIYSHLWKVVQENGMQDTLRKLIRRGPGLWKLSAWESSNNAVLKTLLNLGILTLSSSDSSAARFMDPLVYRACVEAVYRNQSESLPEDKVNNVEGFLMHELKRVKLLEIVSDIVCSRYCPSEASFHQELCELFRRSLPKNIECSFESHSRQMDRLDFSLWRDNKPWVVCELRIGHDDSESHDAAMKQAIKYSDNYDCTVPVYVVNLYQHNSELQNLKLCPDGSCLHNIHVVNLVCDAACNMYKLCPQGAMELKVPTD